MGAHGAFGRSGVWGNYFWADPAERLSVVFMDHAPGELRQHYRRLINMVAYQAIEAWRATASRRCRAKQPFEGSEDQKARRIITYACADPGRHNGASAPKPMPKPCSDKVQILFATILLRAQIADAE
jgi:CubicO group peptidase (beta-lactamase class C family)